MSFRLPQAIDAHCGGPDEIILRDFCGSDILESIYKYTMVALLKQLEGSGGCKLKTGHVVLEVCVSFKICRRGRFFFSLSLSCALLENVTAVYLLLYVCAHVSEFSSKHCQVGRAYFSKAKSPKKFRVSGSLLRLLFFFFLPSHLVLVFFTAFVLSQVHLPFHHYQFSLLL